jgi:PAS domain S-box-containing protein
LAGGPFPVDTISQLLEDRPIDPNCLFCHSNRVEPVALSTNRYRPFVDHGRTSDEGQMLVGQVEQMKASRRYRASQGRLGCVSCHDPHEVPGPEEKTAYFRERCLAWRTIESDGGIAFAEQAYVIKMRFVPGRRCAGSGTARACFGGGLRVVAVDGRFAERDGMPKFSLDIRRPYVCAVLAAALVVILRLVLDPVLGDRQLLLQVALMVVCAGLPIILLGGALRAARERAAASSAELERLLNREEADRESESRRAEQARQESEDRFRQLADRINDVFWINEPDGPRMVYVSPAYESIWGRSCASLYERPMSYLDAVHPDDRDRVRRAYDRIVGGSTTAEEYRVIRPDGTIRWIWDRGFPIKDQQERVVRLAGLAEDITDRRQSEQALRESEERFRTLADATPIMIWGSGADTLCDYFNKQWLDFTGRTFEQEMGNGWADGVHCDDRERCVDTYQTAFHACQPFLMEYRLRRHDGEYRWVLDAGAPRFGPDGTFSGYIGSCLDITERREAEEKLRNADRRKEEFLAVLSHELRNPLAPIQTAVDLLEQAGTSRDQSGHELATIKRQVRNLERLVDDLLDVSRISRGKIELRKEVLPLAQVIAESAEAVRPLVAEQHQQLHVSIPEGPLLLDADRTRLEQILSNLLINAAKYTAHGGQIWLTAERSDREAVIRVRDTGVGIDPEFQGKVFDLFVQGERRLARYRYGAGIGLSLAKDLVELHGGTITVQSRGPDSGSEFTVRLPALGDDDVATKDSPKLIELVNPRELPRRRILIVDDNVQAADNLGKLLSHVFSQDVRVVYDGPSALDLAPTFRPEVVLLDLEMTFMDGYEVAMRLREQPESSDMLIVAVTGWAQEDYRRRSRETGFDLHMVKPVTAKELKTLLADLEPKLE